MERIRIYFLSYGLWLLGAIVTCGTLVTVDSSRADNFVREIKNKDNITVANDLTLVFLQNVPAGDKVTATDKDGKFSFFTSTGQNKFTFHLGELPSDIAPGGFLQLRFSGPEGQDIDSLLTKWTNFGDIMLSALSFAGGMPIITFEGGDAFAMLTNPDPFAVTYSDITLYKNNELANFNTNNFDVPTGDLVAGTPPSITLDPGASVLLPFGSVLPDTYQLALAHAAAVSAPDDLFLVGSGAVAPELSTWALMLLGFAGLGYVGWRRSAKLRLGALAA